jgi:outer membrane protein assembly factor BamB
MCQYVIRTVVVLAMLNALCLELHALEVRTPEGGAALMFRYRVFDDWEESDSIWGDLCVARNGRVYIGVSNHFAVGGNAVLYCYTPETDELKVVANIGEVVGQHPGERVVGQGKIHTRVMEGKDGRIYGGTMMGGHYTNRIATYVHPRSYPGGHLWAYDPQKGTAQDLGVPVPHEAVYSIWVDTDRGKIYGVTFQRHLFFVYDLKTGEVKVKGAVGVGEDVYADREGMIYSNGPWGNVVKYNPDTDKLVDLPVYFPRNPDGGPGQNGPNMALLGHDGMIYSITLWGYLYRFNPYTGEHGHITTLGFTLGDGAEMEYTPNLALSKDMKTFYYLAGCHGHYITEERKGVHFVEMDAATGKRRDHGLVVTDPLITGCYASGTGPDGTVYFGAQCWGEVSWDGKRIPPGPPILMIYRPRK